jgi:hypothetical protein|tara:strand:+ start:366 stop:950 length:585 start_codon:yes stop_codon:yes gene_type:complete
MSDNKSKKVVKIRPGARKHDRQSIMNALLPLIQDGMSLTAACALVPESPNSNQILDWIATEPALAEQYTLAREAGYRMIADEILSISDENYTLVEEDILDDTGMPMLDGAGARLQRRVKVPLSSESIQRNRLRIDSRKWMLSKMLPKVYGDKLHTEHTGQGGGPIQLAAVDLKSLSDEEIDSMSQMMKKIEDSK